MSETGTALATREAEETQMIPAGVSAPPRKKALQIMAERFNLDPKMMMNTLKSTVMRGERAPSDEEVAAFVIVANEYGLNPFIKEIYAYPDKNKGIVPIVSIDGWIKLVNSHPAFSGFDVEDIVNPEDPSEVIAIKTTMHRSDRNKPTSVIEYMSECRPKEPKSWEPWARWPRRMLRHKSYIQCARYTFGFSGIMDEDEVRRVRETEWAEGAIDVDPRTGQVIATASFTTANPITVKMEAGDPATHQSHDESAAALSASKAVTPPADKAPPAKKAAAKKKAAPPAPPAPPPDPALEARKAAIEKLLSEYGIADEDQVSVVAHALGGGDPNKVGLALRDADALVKLEAYLKGKASEAAAADDAETEEPSVEAAPVPDEVDLGGEEEKEAAAPVADPPEPALPEGKKWAHAVKEAFDLSSFQGDRLEFLKAIAGNSVVKPENGKLNPAAVDFKVFLKLRRKLDADGLLPIQAVINLGSGDLPR
jgi:phage recombination protein Bet